VCVDFLYNFCLKTFLILKIAERDIVVNVNCPLFLSDLKETSIFWSRFSRKVKFHENPSNGRRVNPCGLTDITKLTVALPTVEYTPKNAYINSADKLQDN
jgi:hypothetical protein